MKLGGIILCGGRSTRMGLAKATLPFGPELMLERVARLLSEAASPLVIVAAPEQEVPCPPGATLVRDRSEGEGPLEGIRAGLTALAGQVDAAFASSCDVPLLAPEFVRRMGELLGDDEIAVPRGEAFFHPLAAVYRPSVLPDMERLLAAGRMRPVFLFEETRTRAVPVEELRAVDAHLGTLVNCNHPADYLAALAQAGFSASPEILAHFRRSGTSE